MMILQIVKEREKGGKESLNFVYISLLSFCFSLTKTRELMFLFITVFHNNLCILYASHTHSIYTYFSIPYVYSNIDNPENLIMLTWSLDSSLSI